MFNDYAQNLKLMPNRDPFFFLNKRRHWSIIVSVFFYENNTFYIDCYIILCNISCNKNCIVKYTFERNVEKKKYIFF